MGRDPDWRLRKAPLPSRARRCRPTALRNPSQPHNPRTELNQVIGRQRKQTLLLPRATPSVRPPLASPVLADRPLDLRPQFDNLTCMPHASLVLRDASSRRQAHQYPTSPAHDLQYHKRNNASTPNCHAREPLRWTTTLFCRLLPNEGTHTCCSKAVHALAKVGEAPQIETRRDMCCCSGACLCGSMPGPMMLMGSRTESNCPASGGPQVAKPGGNALLGFVWFLCVTRRCV